MTNDAHRTHDLADHVHVHGTSAATAAIRPRRPPRLPARNALDSSLLRTAKACCNGRPALGSNCLETNREIGVAMGPGRARRRWAHRTWSSSSVGSVGVDDIAPGEGVPTTQNAWSAPPA